MKDNTISYDLVHHPQHSWNHQRQQQQHQQQHQQTHSPNVYANQHGPQPPGSQARSIGAHHQQQQNQQHATQLEQYPHQQLPSAAHHGTNPAASAYYQQAHLYQSFQDQQQQAGPDHHHHHHHGSLPPVSASGQATSAHAAAVAAAQQQHAAVHNQQATNTQASALNHAVWSPGVGALTPQAHHAVVTDHSTLAYMTHAYQNHNSPVNDHHRNSSGPMTNQPIGTGPQASSYAVDTMYNSSAAAAAAAAAYGYNNYNAAFFQSSNNSPHTQAGHPSQAGLSAFWNHNQGSQQRSAHPQAVAGQASIQQRQQQMASDQASGYMHDPRLYYGRPPYGQVMQNFGQHQTQTTQQQSDISQDRVSTLSQQPSLVQHQDHQLQDFEGHQSQQMPLSGQQQSTKTTGPQANLAQQSSVDNQLSSTQSVAPPQALQARKLHSPKLSPQHPTQKQSVSKSDKPSQQAKNLNEYDQLTGTKNPHSTNSNQIESQQLSGKDLDNTTSLTKQPKVVKDHVQPSPISSLSSAQTTQPVTKSDPVGQFQAKKQSNPSSSQTQGRNVYRSPQDDRIKPQIIEATKKSIGERDLRPSMSAEVKNQPSSTNNRQQDSDPSHSIEDSLATLSLSSRKTTWASIASQPAKVAQPKSLKSKIAGSNSVLSSAKHLASSVTLDSSSLDSKNGINPAIKNSVSAAATPMQRGSIPPPISKVAPAANPSLKLDLLGEESVESAKISWPAVNASINLTLDDPPLPKTGVYSNSMASSSHVDKLRNDDDVRKETRDPSNRDYNHNQGANAKMVNNYQHSQSHRDDRRDDFWTHRRDQRDYRVRRDSDRKDMEPEKRLNDDPRNQMNTRRDFKPASRVNHFREDESPYRDQKRGAMMDRNDHRGNDNYRFVQNRFDNPRDSHHGNHPQPVNNNRNIETAPHHHYNNLRDGNSTRNTQGKLDISLHPHLNPTNYNPKNFDCEPENARYFIIKSYSEDDIHRSIKYSIWCSTNHGNKRLDEAFRQQQAKNGQLFLFFSVNGSGHFCGIAQMTSAVDFDSSSGVWAQSKWQGEFSVKWIYVKDVPNSALRHITLENNEDKPVTNSRDTQEVPSEKGKSVLTIIHQYPHTTSLFDDFLHYERRQEEEKMKKSHSEQHHNAGRPDERDNRGTGSRYNRPYTNPRIHNDMRDHPGNRDRPSRYVS